MDMLLTFCRFIVRPFYDHYVAHHPDLGYAIARRVLFSTKYKDLVNTRYWWRFNAYPRDCWNKDYQKVKEEYRKLYPCGLITKVRDDVDAAELVLKN